MAYKNDQTSPDQVVNDPSSQLFSSLAEFYRENGLMSEAINICLTGLEASPDNLEGRMVLAKCYLATREFAKSREQLTKILTSQHENSAAKRLLAEVDREEKMASGEQIPAAAPQPAPAQAAPAQVPEAVPLAAPAKTVSTPYPGLLAEVLAPPEPRQSSAQEQKAEPLPSPLDQARGRPVQERISVIEEPPARPGPAPKPAQEPPRAAPRPPLEYVAEPEPAAETKPPAAPPAAAEQPAERGLQTNYNRILQDLVQTPQVLGSLLVDESGFVVASAFGSKAQGNVDEESSGALAVSIFGTGREAIKKIRMGELERLVIDTPSEKIFLNRAGPMLLLVSAETSAKVGLVAVNTRQAVDRIRGQSAK